MLKKTACSLFLLLTLFNSNALENRIVIDTWYEIEHYSAWDNNEIPEADFSEQGEEQIHQLLEEARIILSSMIYGYSFSYIPQDNARGVKDWFDLKPIEEIEWGDPNLEIISSEVVDNRVICKIVYNLSDYQEARRSSWYSNTIPYSTGTGQENYFFGFEAKLTSIKNSIKEAIRNYARARVINKPREIKGEVLVWDSPYTVISEGNYTSTVKIKLLMLEIIPYTVF
jgi:hypothetical protein